MVVAVVFVYLPEAKLSVVAAVVVVAASYLDWES